MKNIFKAIKDKEYDKSLKLIHDYVDSIITEPFFTGRLFGSRELDNFCQIIGCACLDNLKHLNTATNNNEPAIFVYVVTKLNKTGGHTRVLKDFINSFPSKTHYILSTEIVGNSDFKFIKDNISSDKNVLFECAPRDSFWARLTWLQSRLLLIGASKVYLFNHHQDSVAVAAIQPEMNLDAYFYHHADHHLCLGVYLTHLKHIDPHPMGYHNCRIDLGIDNIYLPLRVADRLNAFSNYKFLLNKTLTTCTAANSNKIEIPYFISYTKLVPKLLKVTGGRHVHIGKLSPWAIYEIRSGLARNGIDKNCFLYIPWVPSVWDALILYKVDLYIASFPYGGGLTLIEAMGAGIPVALHRHKYVDFLSGVELASPDAFVWHQPEDLFDYCKNISHDTLVHSAYSGRLHFEKFHSENHLLTFFNTGNECKPFYKERNNKHVTDIVEYSSLILNHFTFSHFIYRALYRLAKRIRNNFF